MIWFKNKLYGTIGINCERFIFVRSTGRVLGKYAWTRVERIFPGIYKKVGKTFIDNEDMFFKLNDKKFTPFEIQLLRHLIIDRFALAATRLHKIEKRAARIRAQMAKEMENERK